MSLTLADSPVLAGLTAQQLAAVTHEGGPLLVVAGAGTGKTRVLTRRIAWLISAKHARPEEILALTFTDKAAAEMEERVDLLVPYGYADVWVSTFHAFADRTLREHAVDLGLPPDFRVLTRPEQVLLLREHLFELPLERFRPLSDPTRFLHALVGAISRAKDEDVGPEAYAAFAADLTARAAAAPDDDALADRAARETEIAALYGAYQALLAQRGLVDFGDQITLLLTLLRRHPAVRERLTRRFRWLLVDEFQDTNHAQFEILRLLAGAERNVMVVADDDQAIYTFRGAESRNILAFADAFPDTAEVVLTENYRSRQDILDAARRLIVFNDPERLEVRRGIDKRLSSRRAAGRDAPVPQGPAVRHLHTETMWEEADAVAEEVAGLVASGLARNEIGILVRANADADPFLRALNLREIPWRFSGNQGLYGRPEITVFRHLLRVLAQPDDAQSLYALAASPPYALPPADLRVLLASASRRRRALRLVMEAALAAPSIAGDAPPSLFAEPAVPLTEDGRARLTRLLDDLARLGAAAARRPTGEVLYDFLNGTGWLAQLVKRERPDDEEAVQNIARFFELVRRFGEVAQLDRVPFFEQHLSALIASGDDPPVAEAERDVDAVHVLTIHKAKGLEFTAVFLVGLVQGRFPSQARGDAVEFPSELVRAGQAAHEAHLAEERRLCYVGMTRARDLLVLSSAADYGGRRTRKVSQFVAEALDRTPPRPRARLAPEVAIARHALSGAPEPPVAPLGPALPRDVVLPVTAAEVDDYLTCPLRYQFIHLLHVPMQRHHGVVYGHAVRDAVRAYLRRRAAGDAVPADDVVASYGAAWTSEGFLTREHEERRFAEGEEALRRFHADEEAASAPTWSDKPYAVQVGKVRLRGQWERIDAREGRVEIREYRSTDVHDQDEADRRARDSRALLFAALAWRETEGALPDLLAVRFVGSGLEGRLPATRATVERGRRDLAEAAEGIRERRFEATPSTTVCRRCAYGPVCPESAAPRE